MSGISVSGIDQFNALLRQFRADSQAAFLETCNEQAKATQKALKAAAPVGPTGNLKKAIKRLKARDERGKQHAVVYISRRTAPHFHLVVFGTSQRFTKYRRAYIGGRWVSLKHAKNKDMRRAANPLPQGKMKPNPFFRQQVERAMPEFMQRAEAAARKAVDGVKTRRRR